MTGEHIREKYLKRHIPFKHGGRTVKEGLDCYGLIKCIYADAGIELIDIEDYCKGWHRKGKDYFLENYQKQFMEVISPHFLDVVLLRNNKGMANHAGVVLYKNKFIHCSRAGVNVQQLSTWHKRISGFYRIKT